MAVHVIYVLYGTFSLGGDCSPTRCQCGGQSPVLKSLEKYNISLPDCIGIVNVRFEMDKSVCEILSSVI